MTVARLTPRGTWVFDNAAGRASRNGSTVLSWTSFERFELNHSRNSTVSFTGGPRAEHVRSLVALDRASLGEGNDTLEVWPERLADSPAMRIAGAGGNDLLRLGRGDNDGNVDLDLAAGTVRFVRPTQAGRTSRVTGFERTHVYAMWARVLGTTGADRIGWDACHGSVSGRTGDDALIYLPIQEDSCGYMGDAATIRIYGGRGNDQLRGGFMPDVLLGGSGRDTADGRAGRDLCRVEFAQHCERR
ncbi:hypothetical protein ASH02_21395 [Nocardioides sp. Soil796]|nr:hypothetical protein ASH02_21395 [Nocardioides sp. Soil796]